MSNSPHLSSVSGALPSATGGSGSRLAAVPAGTLGLDRGASIGPQAAALYGCGYRFAIRIVNLPTHGTNGALTAEEAKQILASGLGLALFQIYRIHGITTAQGTADGQFAAQTASGIGFPKGALLWCDLESSAECGGQFFAPDGSRVSAQTMSTYLANWASAVTSAGYQAGLYNGPQALLTGEHLSALPGFTAFWKAAASVPTPTHGYQLGQRNPNKMVDGINIDENVAEADAKGQLPLFWFSGPSR